ncbi:MAG: phosphoglycolate phosphatase [Parvularculaceae bacterium]
MSDHCTDSGAARLALRIKEYWRKKGFDVDLDMRPEGFVSTMRSARTDVRSDMVNGMPRRNGSAGIGA